MMVYFEAMAGTFTAGVLLVIVWSSMDFFRNNGAVGRGISRVAHWRGAVRRHMAALRFRRRLP